MASAATVGSSSSGGEGKSTGPLFVKCSICKRDVTNVHIRCAECTSPVIDMCIECFALGSVSPDVPHKREHAYHVMDNLSSFVLYDAAWSAKEEIMLLDGIDMFGFGNWKEIAAYLGSKSHAEAAAHYAAVYLDAPTAPLPSGDPSRTLYKGSTGDAGGGTDGEAKKGAQHGRSGTGAAAAGATGSGTPGYSHAHIPKVDVAGYMPLRGDFDVEHDNDAEMVLADMDFTEGEHATETELKLKMLEIYNAKLDERERRKAFVIERGLLEYKRVLAVERRRPKEEREVYDQFRPFARFMSPAEHEQLVRGIILENRLRKRIAQLQEYRRLGIKSLAEAAEYEATKRRKDGSGGGAAATQWAGLTRRASDAPTVGGAAAASAAKVARRASNSVPASSEVDMTPDADAAPVAADASSRKRRRGVDAPGEGDPVGAAAAGADGSSFSLEGIPGVERLSPQERGLCEYLHLLPAQYGQIKATIVNMSYVRGFVKRNEAASTLVNVDVVKVNGVYDFCVTAGWATPSSLDDLPGTLPPQALPGSVS